MRRLLVTAILAVLFGGVASKATHPPITWTPGEFYFRDAAGASTLLTSTNPFGATDPDYNPLFLIAGPNGERIVRIHVAKFYNLVTTGAGIYQQAWFDNWEAIFQQAELQGLYVLPVLDVWSNWNPVKAPSGWPANIFNTGASSSNCTSPVYSYPNCGPATMPSDLLFDAATQTQWLGLIERMVTEWMDNDNIIGWEVFSELDLIEGYDAVAGCPVVDGVIVTVPCPAVQLFEAAAARVRALDPRPITASTAGVNDMPALWTSAWLDWGQLHPYAGFPPYSGNLDQLILDKVRQRRTQYGKPVFIGESGLDTLFPSDKNVTLALKPRARIGINQALWAAAVSGAMNARGLWFEDGYDYETAAPIRYNICTHAELSVEYAAACASAGGVLFLHDLYADAAMPVHNFVAGVDYTGFVPVPLTDTLGDDLQDGAGDLLGAALGDETMVIGWVRDLQSDAPLVTDPGNGAYSLTDHWPWRNLIGQQVKLDMPAAAASADWLVEFWDTTTGTRLETIDADQDVNGDITFTLRDFEGSLAFKVYPVAPLTVTINVTPGRPNNNRIPYNNQPLFVAIMSSVTGAGYPDDFLATSVLVSSIAFGPGLAAPGASLQTDVDGDATLDLLLGFRKANTQLPCGWSIATLTGETTTGRLITGSALVRVVGCPP